MVCPFALHMLKYSEGSSAGESAQTSASGTERTSELSQRSAMSEERTHLSWRGKAEPVIKLVTFPPSLLVLNLVNFLLSRICLHQAITAFPWLRVYRRHLEQY